MKEVDLDFDVEFLHSFRRWRKVWRRERNSLPCFDIRLKSGTVVKDRLLNMCTAKPGEYRWVFEGYTIE